MFYKYNEKTLEYERARPRDLPFIVFGVIIAIVIMAFVLGDITTKKKLVVTYIETTDTIVKENVFTEDLLVEMLYDLNVKFPHIVMAQSIIETGHWTSDIFKKNHNLFGMKEAKRRISTAGGTKKSHAYYENWRESVYDYAFYQCRYLGNINNEEEYFNYLGERYAEDENYVEALKVIIARERLKEKFEK